MSSNSPMQKQSATSICSSWMMSSPQEPPASPVPKPSASQEMSASASSPSASPSHNSKTGCFSEIKINCDLFCISLDLHYLCTQINVEVMEIKNQFAKKLMDIQAIKLQPNDPFTWASGWKSPIYTDNRKTLSFPQLRSFVKLELCHAIQKHFPEAEAVAGVATGAIAQGALVADQLGLPYSYVRPKPKDHGMGNQVEGEIKKVPRW